MNLKQKLAQIALDRMVAENERLGLYHNPEYVDSVNMSEKHVHESDKSIHEPVAYWNPDESGLMFREGKSGTWIPLYMKREWVGLTDEEIEQGCKESWVTEQAWQSAVWWAEAKLKEKNT